MEIRLRRILEMLEFYSDRFARVSLVNLNDVSETAVRLMCSILYCPLSVALIEDLLQQPSLLASSELNPESHSSQAGGQSLAAQTGLERFFLAC